MQPKDFLHRVFQKTRKQINTFVSIMTEINRKFLFLYLITKKKSKKLFNFFNKLVTKKKIEDTRFLFLLLHL